MESGKRRHNEERTWQDENPPKMHSVLNGSVASVQPYGAFIKFPGRKKNGLVHKSQISKVPVDNPSEVLAVGDDVYAKVISVDEDGKIGLCMKVVNQTTGEDLDPNHIQAAIDERRRKTGFKSSIEKIELGAILNTTCKKCGAKGHFSKDCFKTPGSSVSYDLIPDIDELMEQEKQNTEKYNKEDSKSKKKKKKEKKEKKKKKRKHEDTDSENEYSKAKKQKKSHKKKHKHRRSSTSSSGSSDQSSSSEDERERHRKTKKKHRR